MPSRDAKSSAAFGFYTVVEQPQIGLLGGYLVVNAAGRPLEFHCTAPVKPTRAQTILFGATLEPYLYGEHIGQALIRKAETLATVICTDRPQALAVRQYIDAPVALIVGEEASIRTSIATPSFTIGTVRLAVAGGFTGDESLVAERIALFAASMPLAEPFERIRQAIDEAQRGER
ncbi:MAG TPA: hypothetical protein VHZ24_17290 [Pirellulales bacterium]|jgi:hypothetical protein|nr:hypothetical protein [Pirellulales bacterium]